MGARRGIGLRASLDLVYDRLREAGLKVTARGDHLQAQCPTHDDGTASLSIDWRNGQTLLHCHAGCTDGAGGKGDPSQVIAALGLSAADLFDEPLEPKPAVRAPRARTGPGRRARSPRAAAAAAPQVSIPAALVPPAPVPRPPAAGEPAVVATYDYEDVVDGQWTVVAHVDRIEPDFDGGAKTFRQRRAGVPAGRGRHWKGYGLRGLELPLYRARQLAGASPDATVWVVGGEKDVHSLVGLGEVATTNPMGEGPGKWKPAHSEALAGRTVVVVADRDATGYEHALEVAHALSGVAADVRIVVAAVGKDITDHLQAGRSLDQVVAVEAAEVLRALQVLKPARAQRFDNLVHLPLPGRLLDGEAGGGGGAPPGDGGGGPQGEAVPEPDNTRPVYLLRRGELVERKVRPSGEVHYQVLLGCAAQVVAIEYEDDGTPVTGTPPTSAWVVRLWREDPDTGEELVSAEKRVSADDWTDGVWLQDIPWPDVYYPPTKGGRQNAVTAIRLAVEPHRVRVPVYVSPGWREHPGHGLMYVHAGGAVTAGGAVEVRTAFDQVYERVHLPAAPDGTAAAVAAAQASLRLLDELPTAYAAPLLGTVFGAPVRRNGNVLHLQGGPGSGKTSIGSLFNKHFAPRLGFDEGMMSAASVGGTPLRINDAMCRGADCVLFLDDAAPDHGIKDAEVKLNDIGRASANRVRRDKLDIKGQPRRSGTPRATLISSGEVRARAGSAQERFFELAFTPDSVSIDHLAELHELGDQLGTNMAGFLRWLATGDRLAQARDLMDWHRKRLRDQPEGRERLLIRLLDEGLPNRVAAPLSYMACGWLLFLAYLGELGVPGQRLHELWVTAYRGLRDAGQAQAAVWADSDEIEGLRTYLRSALRRGEIRAVTRAGGGMPAMPLAMSLGYRPKMSHTSEIGTDFIYDGQGDVICWVDEDAERILVEPTGALAVARKLAAEVARGFEITEPVLFSRLVSRDLIRWRTEGGRPRPPKVTLPSGGRDRLWDMSLAWLLDIDNQGGEPAWPGDRPNPVLPPVYPDGWPAADWAAEPVPEEQPSEVELPVAVGAEPAAPAAVATRRRARPVLQPVAVIPSPRKEASMLFCDRHPAEVLETVYLPRPSQGGPQLPACLTCGTACGTVYGAARTIALHISCAPLPGLRFDADGNLVDAPAPASVTEAGEDDLWAGLDIEQMDAMVPADDDPPADWRPPAARREAAPAAPERRPAAATPTVNPVAPARPAAGTPETAVIPAPAARRTAGRTRREPDPPRPAAVVADVDGVYFPDGRVIPLPPVAHAGDLAAIAVAHEVGWRDPTRKLVPDAGQVWVTPSLAGRLGLPVARDRDEGEDAFAEACAAAQPFVDAAVAAGWRVQTRGQAFAPWMEVLPADSDRTAAWLVFPGLLVGDSLRPPLLDDDPAPATLAGRLQRYAAATNQAYILSPGESGLRLLGKLRPTKGSKISQGEPVTPPAPLLDRVSANRVVRWQFSWQRPLTSEEESTPLVVAYDINRQFLPAAGQAQLGLGEAEHLTSEVVFDPKVTGLWRARWQDNPWWGLPHLLDPNGARGAERARIEAARAEGDRSRSVSEWFWYPTPVLAQAAEAGYRIEVREAHVWSRTTRYCEDWYKILSDSIKDLVGSGDPDDDALRRTLQLTYKHGIGKFGEKARHVGNDHDPDLVAYRRHRHVNPHWQATIEAVAAANQWRGLHTIAETSGRQPLLVDADLVLFAADTADPFAAAPAGMRIGSLEGGEYLQRNGAYKPKAVIPMAVYRDWLSARLAAAAEHRRGTPPLTDLITPDTLWRPA
ncbi:hypothetical protein [Krasilnikovia sp. MM14-A1259]|uniref:hypothetical protein n=1 Tax=Krasilnikovia sp. MM14-A1259 TaxID=3373539 RepID=UPI00380D6F38